MSTGEMTIASDSFEDHGESTAWEFLEGTGETLDELDACLVECDNVLAKCENDEGADALLLTAGADEGGDAIMEGDDRRSLRVDRR